MIAQIHAFARQHAGLFSGNVLEVGSYNENGTVRDELPITLGVDMRPGKDVDRVIDVRDLIATLGVESFDAVVSCDSLEHMEDWDAALTNMWGVLKPGGVLLLTMAAQSKGWHGYPGDYWRMPIKKLRAVFDGNEIIDQLGHGLVSIGLLVRKAWTIDLSVRPDEIER